MYGSVHVFFYSFFCGPNIYHNFWRKYPQLFIWQDFKVKRAEKDLKKNSTRNRRLTALFACAYLFTVLSTRIAATFLVWFSQITI